MAITLVGSTITIDSGIASGTATGGSANTLTGTGFSTTWAGRIVWITSGTGAGQSRFIRTATATTLTVEPNWDVNPASGSVFSIGYTWADIDAALAGVTVSSPNFYLVPYNLTLFAGGFIGSLNEHVRLTVSVPVLSTAVGSLWQHGRLFNSGVGAQGGSVELAYAPNTGFNNMELSGRVRWYRTTVAVLPGIGSYRINNVITAETLDIRDTYFNNIYVVSRADDRVERCAFNTKPFWVKSAVAPILNGLTFLENSFVISGDNGAGTDSHYFGLEFQGIPQDATFSKPYWVWNTTTKEGTYFWDTAAPAYANTFAASIFFNSPPAGAGFYTGKTVALQTLRVDGTAAASTVVGLWNALGNAAWFTGVTVADGTPINSMTVTTDASGNYANPHPSVAGQSGLVVAERIKQAGATQYGPWTIRARLYGFLEAGGARNYANRSNETLFMLVDPAITQTSAATVAAYTTLETSAKFYDYYQYFLSLAANIKTDNGLSRSGNLINAGSYNVIIDAAAASVFTLVGNTITIKASTFTGDMTTTGLITLANGATFIGTLTDSTGTTATTSVTITNGVAGTRLLIQDVTNPAAPMVLYSNVPTSFPYTWTGNVSGAATIDIRVRAAYQSGTTAKMFVDEEIGTLSVASPSLSYRLNQVDDAVYIANGVNGASVTGITIDDPTLLINVSVPTIGLQSIYAYETYWLSTSAGILDEGRIITAPDTANYIFEGGWKIKNISSPSSPLTITGGYMVDAMTGIAASLIDNTGGTIILAPDHVIPPPTGSSLTPQDKIDIADAVLAAATAAPIHADIRKVNAVTVDGAGTEADPFGPA